MGNKEEVLAVLSEAILTRNSAVFEGLVEKVHECGLGEDVSQAVLEEYSHKVIFAAGQIS